jgi:hypothetical protein
MLQYASEFTAMKRKICGKHFTVAVICLRGSSGETDVQHAGRWGGALPGRRAMRGLASQGRRPLLPNSLMQRLALLANGQLSPPASAAHGQPRRQGRVSTLICFGIGALTSSVLGGVTLLGLRTLNAGEARMHAAGGAGSATVAAVPPALSGQKAAPQIVDVAIERSERAHTALSLRLEGASDADIEVVLRGVPAAARLSKGERRDAMTWVVRRADLDGLHLTLGEAGPDAFDIGIDVLAPSGAATEAGVVRVRVVDAPAPKHAAAETARVPPPDRAGTGDAHHKKAVPAETSIAKLVPAVAPDAGARAKVTRPPPRRTDANPAGAGTAPAARPWPEGASGLGAVPRDSERQVWWSMPPPAWSPFATD